MVSDRDRIFISSLAKVEPHMSLAYHSQSDGQTKRVNTDLLVLFRSCLSEAMAQLVGTCWVLVQYIVSSCPGLILVWIFVCHALQHFGLDPAGDSPSSNLEECQSSSVQQGLVQWSPAVVSRRNRLGTSSRARERRCQKLYCCWWFGNSTHCGSATRKQASSVQNITDWISGKSIYLQIFYLDIYFYKKQI